MISIQKIADALAGRRIALIASRDDARSELKACAAQLAHAESQIAQQRREIALLQNELTIAVQTADRHRSEAASLRAANRGLVRLAEGHERIDGRTPAAAPADQLRRQAEQDRRNAIALEDRIEDLLRENAQLLKALAG